MTAAQTALDILGRPLLAGIEGDWVDRLRAELEQLEPGLLEVLARAALVVGDREHPRPPSASPVRWPSATPSGSPVTRC